MHYEREIVINENRMKLRDSAAFNKLKIINLFYEHKNIHMFPWSERGSQTSFDCIMTNAKLFSGVFRGSSVNSEHF